MEVRSKDRSPTLSTPKRKVEIGKQSPVPFRYMYSINVQCAYFNALLYPDPFRALGVPYVAVSGDTGDIGGSLSHEFQFPAEVGQDSLLVCPECERGSNVEVCKNNRILGNPLFRCWFHGTSFFPQICIRV